MKLDFSDYAFLVITLIIGVSSVFANSSEILFIQYIIEIILLWVVQSLTSKLESIKINERLENLEKKLKEISDDN